MSQILSLSKLREVFLHFFERHVSCLSVPKKIRVTLRVVARGVFLRFFFVSSRNQFKRRKNEEKQRRRLRAVKLFSKYLSSLITTIQYMNGELDISNLLYVY
jgi:hypothetical protein